LAQDTEYTFDESRGRFTYASEQRAIVDAGILPGDVERRYDFDQAVWVADVDLDELHRRVPDRPRFRALPEYPSAWRDLSLVARPGVRFADIQKTVVKSAGALLESLQVFDVYDGSKAGGDWTAYGIRLSFRSPRRTLTDGDVDQVIGKILSDVKKNLGVELRS
jgi:phenylalanyl-tRNA synthetase beta chain